MPFPMTGGVNPLLAAMIMNQGQAQQLPNFAPQIPASRMQMGGGGGMGGPMQAPQMPGAAPGAIQSLMNDPTKLQAYLKMLQGNGNQGQSGGGGGMGGLGGLFSLFGGGGGGAPTSSDLALQYSGSGGLLGGIS